MKGRPPAGKGPGTEEAKEPAKKKLPADVAIDFERLHERVKRIALADGMREHTILVPRFQEARLHRKL